MRVANRLLAALLALTLAAAGVVTAVEIALAGAGDAHWLVSWRDWRGWALGHTWTTTAVQLACYAMCAAGLVLLVLAFSRQRLVALDARTASPDVRARIRRSGLEAALERAALGVDGVTRAGVHITRHKTRITAQSNRRDISGLPDAIAAAVDHRLEPLHLSDPPTVQVHVSPRRQ